jgi:hypothetical protein
MRRTAFVIVVASTAALAALFAARLAPHFPYVAPPHEGYANTKATN